MKSRLEKRLERKTKLNLFLSIVGIIVIMFLVVRYGVPLIVDLGLLFSGNKSSQTENSNQSSFIAPPILDPLPNATNSAQIVISGKADKDVSVEVYLNDELLDKTIADGQGEFSVNGSLTSGDNTVKVREEKNGKKSSFSDTISVSLKKGAPNITLNSPADGQKFEKDQNKANVSGNIDTSGTVTVNGFWAVIDQNNNFSYSLPLKNGDNEIKIVATDLAGNQSEKTIKVNYSQ